jgi:hypothetical protein
MSHTHTLSLSHTIPAASEGIALEFVSKADELSPKVIHPPTNVYNIFQLQLAKCKAGNTNRRERLSTVDLLIKAACFCKKGK